VTGLIVLIGLSGYPASGAIVSMVGEIFNKTEIVLAVCALNSPSLFYIFLNLSTIRKTMAIDTTEASCDS